MIHSLIAYFRSIYAIYSQNAFVLKGGKSYLIPRVLRARLYKIGKMGVESNSRSHPTTSSVLTPLWLLPSVLWLDFTKTFERQPFFPFLSPIVVKLALGFQRAAYLVLLSSIYLSTRSGWDDSKLFKWTRALLPWAALLGTMYSMGTNSMRAPLYHVRGSGLHKSLCWAWAASELLSPSGQRTLSRRFAEM